MNGHSAEERIAQLQARGQAQRLAAQLAMLDAREQLAPLRTAAAVIGVAARALSPSGAAGGAAGRLLRFGIGHPWVSSAVAAGVLRVVKGRLIALLLAAAAGAAVWWLRRPASEMPDRQEPVE
jgi:hypothetical protein